MSLTIRRVKNEYEPGLIRYYIGSNAPAVTHIKEVVIWPSKFEDSDNLPEDPEQNWDEDWQSKGANTPSKGQI